LIEIQCSSVDPVLFSRSSMGERDLPRQCRASRGVEGIPLSQRTGSPPDSGEADLPAGSFLGPSVRPFFLRSFLPSCPHLRGQLAGGMPCFFYPTRAFPTRIRREEVERGRRRARLLANGRPILAKRGDLRQQSGLLRLDCARITQLI
jgi:hypothetical protein